MASLLDKMVQKTGRQPGPTSEISRILFRKGVPKSDELDRIAALPRRALDLAAVPDLSPLYVHTERCGVRGCDLCLSGPAQLLPAQSAALLEAEAVGGALLTIEVGGGKCLGRGTPVLRYDGKIVAVEDVRVGDVLMGPKGPRRVVATCTGRSQLYRVTPVKGDPWVCNDSHILTLIDSVSGDVFDISVTDFLKLPRATQKESKLFLSAVDFAPATPLPLDPYFLGVWFGDGTKLLNGVAISKPDPEIKALVDEIAARYDLHVRSSHSQGGGGTCVTHHLAGKPGNKHNPLLSLLRDLVGEDRKVPLAYLTSSREDRMRFLAGWLDTDGYLHHGGYEIVQKRRDYADAVIFLARSLGLRAEVGEKIIPKYGSYWRVSISGDCSFLPLRIPRKQAPKRLQKKRAERTGFTLKAIDEGEYFGFTLDGDGRFLLGDFTVTHNSLASMLLFDALRAEKGVLFVPPDVRDQLVSQDIPRYGRHFRLPLDRFVIVSYSQLSDPATPNLLAEIDADTWIFDECHSIRRKDSVRSRRVIDEWAEREKTGKPVACAFLSGTFTNGSVRDFAHMSGMALRSRSPVPRTWRDIEDWASALDRVTSRMEMMSPGHLLKFCTEEEHKKIAARELDPQEAARMGFARRLHETAGVVRSYDESESGAALVIRRRDVAVPDEVRSQIIKLESTWSIAGEEISEAARMAAFARQLSQGFYYVWRWPGGVPDKEWLKARRDWHKAVRDQVTYGRQAGIDSPALVTRAVKSGKLPRLEALWRAWDAVRARPEPPKEPVWVSDFLVKDALRWAEERAGLPGGCIIWFSHTAIQAAFQAAGLRVFGKGDSAALVELASSGGPEDAGVIACSINAHRKGKNLQHRWSRNYILCPPATAEPFEQALGRTHRRGQPADEVEVDVCLHTDALEDAMRGAFAVAHYVHQTQMQRHKILRARKVGVVDAGDIQKPVDEDSEDE